MCVCLDNNAWLQNILTSNRLCQFIVRLSVTTVPSKTWGVSLYPGKAKEPSVILAKPQLTCKVEAFAELKTAAVSILRARFACPLVLKEGRGRGAQEESRHNSLLIIFPPDLSRFCVPPPSSHFPVTPSLFPRFLSWLLLQFPCLVKLSFHRNFLPSCSTSTFSPSLFF